MINKILFIITIIFSFSAQASNNCFVAKENGRIIKQEGKCDLRHSPYSSFKVTLSIIGFDSGILKSSNEPLIELTPERMKGIETLYNPQKMPIMYFWNNSHSPSSWIKYSVVWYSQYISQNLGVVKLQEYLEKFNYGNKDISGTPNQNDGLLNSWINNSLQISPLEQLDFIDKLSTLSLPVSKQAQKNTIDIIKLENIWNDWQLYGKTGGGKGLGWFIGWIVKDNRKISFVQYIEQPSDSLISGGLVAKELVKNNLIPIILNLN
ncbi:MAG: class D beta-lactamase [Sphingobacteriia bacterium]|nr:class D beta-lactamase [Sphingobacteriia bacterium]